MRGSAASMASAAPRDRSAFARLRIGEKNHAALKIHLLPLRVQDFAKARPSGSRAESRRRRRVQLNAPVFRPWPRVLLWALSRRRRMAGRLFRHPPGPSRAEPVLHWSDNVRALLTIFLQPFRRVDAFGNKPADAAHVNALPQTATARFAA